MKRFIVAFILVSSVVLLARDQPNGSLMRLRLIMESENVDEADVERLMSGRIVTILNCPPMQLDTVTIKAGTTLLVLSPDWFVAQEIILLSDVKIKRKDVYNLNMKSKK